MDNMKVAQQVAGVFCKKHKELEYDEVLSEAYIIMIDAISTWEPDKGRALPSWVGFMIHRNLKKIFHDQINGKKNIQFEICEDSDEALNKLNPEQIYMQYDKIEKLSSLSKQILSMLFNGEIEVKKNNKNTIKSTLKKKLREKGIAFNKIQSAFHELKIAAMT